MFSELQLIKDEDLGDFVPDSSIDCETRKFKAFGYKKNGKVTRIQLDDETQDSDEFVQHLYFPEYQVLTGFLTANLPGDCEFRLEGIIARCANGVGNLGLGSISVV